MTRQSRSTTRPCTTPRPAAPRPRPGCATREAYARFLDRKGKKTRGAFDVLNRIDEFRPGACRSPRLREQIEAGQAGRPLVDGPVDGASEVLLDLGTALNRSGGELSSVLSAVARALKPNSDAVLLQLAPVAEQQNNAEEAIALYRADPGQFADQAGGGVAARA